MANQDTHISVTVSMKDRLKKIAERDHRSMRETLNMMIKYFETKETK